VTFSFVMSPKPLLVALPSSHPAAKSPEVDLYQLRNDALILTPRNIGPTHFDTVISACRQAGFEPLLGQSALQIGTVINLVAADLGFSLVPASMSQLQVTGVLYRAIKGKAPVARLALAYRRGETSKIVRNFIARVTA
jgi:DNA-binding transcriptional LysR family regulator